MFGWCSSLAELDVRGFDTANVTNMAGMFDVCEKLTRLDVSGFNTSNVTSMEYMFGWCRSLAELDVSGFDTANVTNMAGMFDVCEKLTRLDLSGFNTSNVTDMNRMFRDCNDLIELNVSGFDTSNVTDMCGTFCGCHKLTKLDLSGFNTSKVTNMNCMFEGTNSLTYLDTSGFDTSNVTNMAVMFYGCSALTELDVTGFDTSEVTYMHNMFQECSKLTRLDVSSFDTSKVKDMSYMFGGCTSIESLDLTGFNTGNLNAGTAMPFSAEMGNVSDLSIGLGENVDFTRLQSTGEGHGFMRYKTLDGNNVDTPIFNSMTGYDGSSPGWYKIKHSPDYKVEGIEATCEQPGIAPYWVCRCGKIFSDEECNNEIDWPVEPVMITALGHDWGEWEEVEPSTCIKEGQMVRVCKRDPDHKEYRSIDLLAHNLQEVELLRATEKKEGHIRHWKCTVCGEYFSDPDGMESIGEDDITIPKNNMNIKVNTLKAKAKKKTVIKANSAFTIKNNKGKMSYKKTGGDKKITISSAGNITIKKGLKAGKTYSVKVKVISAQTNRYAEVTKIITLKVKVK